MSGSELDEFARLWRGEEDAEEQRVFRRLAWRVGLKAKILRFADYGMAALVVAAATLAMLSDATPATLLFGILLGTAAVWSTWKRRMLHQSRLLGDVNDRETLLATAGQRCALELRQARWGLLLFPLGIMLAGVMKFSAQTGGQVQYFPAAFAASMARGESPVLALIMIGLGEAYFLYRAVRLRRELASLAALQVQYRAESALDDAGDTAAAH